MFVPGQSLLHQLHPLTKLVGLIWVISAATVLRAPGTACLTVCGLAVAFGAGVGPRVLGRFLLTMAPLAIALGVVHGVLIARPDAIALGPLAVSPAGLAFAATIVARVAAILTASLLFVTTTHPGDLLKSLDAGGAPPSLSYLIASPLLLLEPLSNRAKDIRDAQRARGLDLTGSWRARTTALPVLLIPLITLALTDLDHRVLVLNGRAFRSGKRRTVINPPADSSGQRWFRRIAIVLAVAQLGLLIPWH